MKSRTSTSVLHLIFETAEFLLVYQAITRDIDMGCKLKFKTISLSVFVFFISMNGVGCSVNEKSVYGNLQALDLQYEEDKSDLLIANVEEESAARFRTEGERVWWVLNQLNKEKEIYAFPANALIPDCRAIDKLKQRVRLNGDFEKKAYSTCRK